MIAAWGVPKKAEGAVLGCLLATNPLPEDAGFEPKMNCPPMAGACLSVAPGTADRAPRKPDWATGVACGAAA